MSLVSPYPVSCGIREEYEQRLEPAELRPQLNAHVSILQTRLGFLRIRGFVLKLEGFNLRVDS